MEIIHETKQRQDIKKIHKKFYNMIAKIKEQQKKFQERLETQYVNKFNEIENNNNNNESNPKLTATTKIKNCTLNHCLIIGDNNNKNKIKKRKFNYDEKEDNKISILTNEVIEKIMNTLKDESLRENLTSCLERKTNNWEYGGFVCTTAYNNEQINKKQYDNNNIENQETKRCIFLKKGNNKWLELLQIIGFNSTKKKINLEHLKHRLVPGSKCVRLDGVQNKNTVNKRQFVVLSST